MSAPLGHRTCRECGDVHPNRIYGEWGRRCLECRKRPHGNLGKVRSAETIERMRIAHMGITHTAEARAKMSRAKQGRPLTAEHRAKIGKAVSAFHAARKGGQS